MYNYEVHLVYSECFHETTFKHVFKLIRLALYTNTLHLVNWTCLNKTTPKFDATVRVYYYVCLVSSTYFYETVLKVERLPVYTYEVCLVN